MRSENGDSFGEGGKVMAVSMVVAFLDGDEVLGSEGGRGMAWGSIGSKGGGCWEVHGRMEGTQWKPPWRCRLEEHMVEAVNGSQGG